MINNFHFQKAGESPVSARQPEKGVETQRGEHHNKAFYASHHIRH
jgi:hypothetical protein